MVQFYYLFFKNQVITLFYIISFFLLLLSGFTMWQVELTPPGIQLMPPTVEAISLNHRTRMEIPVLL